MKKKPSAETSHTAQSQIAELSNFHSHKREILKPHNCGVMRCNISLDFFFIWDKKPGFTPTHTKQTQR
jgi:hypothetical protein